MRRRRRGRGEVDVDVDGGGNRGNDGSDDDSGLPVFFSVFSVSVSVLDDIVGDEGIERYKG